MGIKNIIGNLTVNGSEVITKENISSLGPVVDLGSFEDHDSASISVIESLGNEDKPNGNYLFNYFIENSQSALIICQKNTDSVEGLQIRSDGVYRNFSYVFESDEYAFGEFHNFHTEIVQTTGNGTNVVMSQKAVTDAVSEKASTETVNGIKAEIDAKIKENKDNIAILNGNSSVENSVDKKITDAINKFATDVIEDNTVNTYKELIDYAASHGKEFTTLVGIVTNNSNSIETLNGDENTAGSVSKKIKEAIELSNTGAQVFNRGTDSATSKVIINETDWDAFVVKNIANENKKTVISSDYIWIQDNSDKVARINADGILKFDESHPNGSTINFPDIQDGTTQTLATKNDIPSFVYDSKTKTLTIS